MIKNFLFETELGFIILTLFEQITGCCIVPLEDIEEERYKIAGLVND